MVVIDATMLMLFLKPDAAVPAGIDGRPIPHARERVEALIAEMDKQGIKILIPTPALSEVLVRAGPGKSEEMVDQINRMSVFRIESFDARAAIEVAAMTRAEIGAGRKKKADSGATYAKIKYDRQIVAIAKVNQATVIYSDDSDIRKIAARSGIQVVALADLPVPAEKQQIEMFKLSPPDVSPLRLA